MLPIDSDGFKDLLVVLASAGLVIPAFAAIRVPAAVGFILVGIVAGPFGFAMLSSAENLAPAAEIGVAMLLFALGLELTYERLRTMRRLVFGLGAAQLGLCGAALAAAGMALGLGLGASLALGVALALSSTAVGLQQLAASGRINTQAGRTAFGILLFQDIAIAPVLLVLTAGAAGAGFGWALGKGVLAIVAIVIVGRLALKPLFLQAARTRSPELFLAAALVVVIGAAATTSAAGLSPVVGALVAGLVLAETDWRRQIEAAIAPFQGLLLGVFLIWAGMQLDFNAVMARPLVVGLGVAGVLALKAGIVFATLRAIGRPTGLAAHVALVIAPTSETGLVVLGVAVAAGLLAGPTADLALLVISLGLALAPLLGIAGARLGGMGRDMASEPAPPPLPEGRTVIIGFGRVGQTVAAMLERHGRHYIAVDSDPDAVASFRAAGRPVVYGDARRPELLAGLHLETAPAIVLTIDAPHSLDTLVRIIRQRHPELCVVARARDAEHAARLYTLGVTDAVPETVESSLQLAEAVLIDLGVPMGLVIASIHEKRSEMRATMTAGATLLPVRPHGRRRLRDAGGG